MSMDKNGSSDEDKSICPKNPSCSWPTNGCTQCLALGSQNGYQLITSFQNLEINEDEKGKGNEDVTGTVLNNDHKIVHIQPPQTQVSTAHDEKNEELKQKWDSADEPVGVGAAGSENGSQSSQHLVGECLERAGTDDKWACVFCTYHNWPRAMKCVMCLNPRSMSTTRIPLDVCTEEWSSRSASPPNNRLQTTPNNHTRTNLHPNNRGLRRVERRWLDACHGVVDGNIGAVEAYLTGGGDPSRQLTETDVTLLDRPSAFDVGLTLIHLALRFQQENILGILLSKVDESPTVVKRVPSSAAPGLALQVRRHVMSMLKEPKGNFACHVVSEITTFTLPPEIEEYDCGVQENVYDDVLDRDVQKELEESQIINWSSEVIDVLNSRLYALWNRSAGDCLLDSVLQATWAIFDQDNGLRQALSLSLQECGSMFYTRWRDNENMHARLLDFSLNEGQCASDFSKLISLASKPGSSLEQLHIFVLAHILRRPIVVYGVKIVKSFRGETLGYAHYEGVYLPLFWDPAFCYKSPICLGYTRGHFSALVTMDPDCDPLGRSTSRDLGLRMRNRCSYLPLTTVDGNLLPIHFLTEAELGKEEVLMSEWLDVRFTDSGLMVAAQQIQTPPLLVTQMTEEWLNHYRPVAQVSRPFLRPPSAPSGWSSDGE